MKTILLLPVLQEQGGAMGGSGMMSMLLMLVAVFAVMYFMMVRPQQKKQKQINEMRNSLQKGDKVITAGGIYGTIVELKEKYVILEVDTNVHIRIDRSTIFKDTSDIQSTK